MKVFRDRECNEWWVQKDGHYWFRSEVEPYTEWVQLKHRVGFELCKRLGGIEESSELEYVVLTGKAIVLGCK